MSDCRMHQIVNEGGFWECAHCCDRFQPADELDRLQAAAMTTAEKITEAEVILLAYQAIANAGSQRAWADALGVSPVFVCNVVRGHKPPSTSMCAALGVEKQISVEYRAIELAEQSND